MESSNLDYIQDLPPKIQDNLTKISHTPIIFGFTFAKLNQNNFVIANQISLEHMDLSLIIHNINKSTMQQSNVITVI